jgi:hypothetical protein
MNLLLIAIVAVLSLLVLVNVVNVYGQSNSDFHLEAKVNTDSPLDPLKITKLEHQGKGYETICTSLKCTIDFKDRFTFFSAPSPQNPFIGYKVEFRIEDNITHAGLGPKKKEAMEQYGASMFGCKVNDIIEENWQELYICHNDANGIGRNFDDASWYFDTIGTIDAKNSILKINSNFTE